MMYMCMRRLLTIQALKIIVLTAPFVTSCNNNGDNSSRHDQATEIGTAITDTLNLEESIVFKSENVIVRKLSTHIYEHTSFLDTESFGRVPCNGMIIINNKEAVVFDTPANSESSKELIEYITKELNCQIKAVVATHFHADCVAGLENFHANDIPSYAFKKTVELLKAAENKHVQPENTFEDVLTLEVGDKKVYAEYFGEGHTKDNIIGYFPEDQAIFGGCLVKEVGAKKGNLEDANVNDWSETVKKIQQKYPEVKIVIPGHGKSGGSELLDYTITLFQ